MGDVLERRDASTDKRTILVVIGDKGAIHYWHEPCTESSIKAFGQTKFGGVEQHSRTPFSYSGEQPDHDDCWLLQCPCWHDGSSLYASEYAIPRWEEAQRMGDMESFWRFLECEYQRRFNGEVP